MAIPSASKLIGDPIAYRNGSPAAVLACERMDTVRVEWPRLAQLDRHEARLLDRRGQPLSFKLPVSENARSPNAILATELAVAPLARGEYLLELVAQGADVTERKLLALRVR